MALKVDYIITEKQMNWKISLIGIIYLMFRFIFMSAFIEPDGRLHPEVFHTSYLISIMLGLSMVFSFRVKPLNSVAFLVFPSVIFSLFLHDIPIWIDPSTWGPQHQVGGLLWWNFLTIHTPIPILAAYTYLTRKETLSLHSLFMLVPIGLAWFFALDDKQNGIIDGPSYLALAFPLMVVWGIIYFLATKDTINKDPIIAPIVKITSIKWIKNAK